MTQDFGAQDYIATTHGITITVRPTYLDEQSRPEEGYYAWAYRVRIANHGKVTVQLLKRMWQITDARGLVQVVRGDGVIGEQPIIPPGRFYEYQSGSPLSTPSGMMVGVYHMIETATGLAFDAQIPAFSLDSPHQSRRVH